MNHSKKFWAEMDKIVGDGKKLRKEMRECRGERSQYRPVICYNSENDLIKPSIIYERFKEYVIENLEGTVS